MQKLCFKEVKKSSKWSLFVFVPPVNFCILRDLSTLELLFATDVFFFSFFGTCLNEAVQQKGEPKF